MSRHLNSAYAYVTVINGAMAYLTFSLDKFVAYWFF